MREHRRSSLAYLNVWAKRCENILMHNQQSWQGFYNTFNVSPFIPVVVSMAITHHSLLTSLRVNMSHIPLQMYLSPLASDATVASRQMAFFATSLNRV